MDVKAGENVADVCCGSGSYIVSAAMEEPEAIYQGYELNVVNKTAVMIRAELLNSHIDISLCDVFSVADVKKMPKYDKIFANYPFGLKLRHLGAGMEYLSRTVSGNFKSYLFRLDIQFINFRHAEGQWKSSCNYD